MKMKCSACGFKIEEGSETCSHCGAPIFDSSTTKTKHWRDGEMYDEMIDFSFSPGDSFGKRYRIEEEIGRGGMGRIYKAWDKELEIFVAIKMIHPELLARPDAVRRFKQELRLAREITHENVVRIHDFGELEGIKFISMQYIDGVNLSELIQGTGAVKLDKALDIATQICRGLRTAHNLGIIHRDLKPQNVMLGKNGKVYITDFGLAKSLEEPSYSMSGIVMGTPQYLSPEQAKGEKLDQRSDIYTLGVLLYEMVTGKELFISQTALGYLQKHIQEKPTSPSIINATIPPYLEKIILKCLEKEPDHRYQSLDELLNDLGKEKTKSQPIIAPRKIKKIFQVTLVLFAILAILFVIYTLLNVKAPTTLNVAVMPFEIRTEKTDLQYWRETFQDLLITDLDQSRYFRVLPGRRLYEILKGANILESKYYSTKDFREVARKGNITHIIYGKLLEVGGWYQVMVGVWRVGNEEEVLIEPLKVKEVNSFPRLVDQLTQRIKDKFLSRRVLSTDIDDKEIGQITTHYPEALKYYIEGKKLFNEGKFEESISYFKKATSIDQQFAAAYRSMAWSYTYLVDRENSQKCFLKTLELIEHVSLRERYLIQGDHYSEEEETHDLAIAAYKELLANYPGDIEANKKLGLAYYTIRDWDEAIHHYEVCFQNNDPDIYTYIFLGYSYMAKGKYQRSREVFNSYIERFSDHFLIHRYLAYSYCIEGKYELASTELDKVDKLKKNDHSAIMLRFDILVLKKELGKAERLLQAYCEKNQEYVNSIEIKLEILIKRRNLSLLQGKFSDCIRFTRELLQVSQRSGFKNFIKISYLMLAYTYLTLDNPTEGLSACNRVPDKVHRMNHFSYERTALFLQTLLYLEKGDLQKADATNQEMLAAIKKGAVKDHIKFYYHYLGMRALKNHRYEEAIKNLWKSISYLNYPTTGTLEKDEHAFFYYNLATAYLKKGNVEKAEKVYLDIISMTTGRLYYGDIYAYSHYCLGNIYRKNGEKRKAVLYYKEFTKLWENCDPPFKKREWEEARKWIAELNK